HVGDAVAFTLDGKVVSAPTIQGAIFGTTEISGQFSQAQAQNLAGVLRYGSLPLSFDPSDAQTVSATLGLASLEAGLIAGGIGLALVFIYCLLYYRVLGILTILSLVLSGVIVFAVLVLLGRWIGFTLDGKVVSAPTIQGAIFGTTEIYGQFSQAQAQNLAGVLRYGSLPLSFESSEAQTVSATLGLASLDAGLIAGGIGLALVFVYCLIYYRVLGILTILSLVLSGVIVFAVLVLLGRWIGFTLDLSGVAGFIVAIGITADSFVIFFERLKDEMRDGRTFRSAVPRGWVRARRTILSADAVSFLASAVLYLLAVGQVKGFAFTLGLSTVLDLVVVFLVTHPLVALASSSRVFGSPTLSGLGAVARIGAQRRQMTAASSAGKGGA
ncbi:MAG: preprotein translocase subunit SecD, partial [Pseudonocardiales bacterium]|nr:preprotein translocase subunit SecD [Pseudonocardiales bacterium]